MRHDIACDANPSARGQIEPRGPFTHEIRARLAKLSELLNGADNNLAELRVEKMGPWPENDSSDGLAKTSAGQFEDILLHFDALLNRAEHVGYLSQVLRDSI